MPAVTWPRFSASCSGTTAAFQDMLRFQLTVRSEFERLSATDPDTLTDLERAARFLYLQRLSYGGKVEGRTFAWTRRVPAPSM